MKVKITPVSGSEQIFEFNNCLPVNGNTAIAPVATLTFNQRWAEVYNSATTGAASYVQITKMDIIHNLQYTDCQGHVRLLCNRTSTVFTTPATSTTPTTLVPNVNEVIDVIIPACVETVTQQVLAELPTTVATKGDCAYSVFAVSIPAAPTPA